MNEQSIFRIGSRRATRLKTVKQKDRNRNLEFFAGELEKRQLLSTFAYDSGSGLLTIQTDSANEQLSIISTSESGNYTITTSSGVWTGSETDISASGSSLFVNQPSGLASILVNDQGGTIANSSFGFGSSSANFVSNLTVHFTNANSGNITVANPLSFINGKSLSLTTTSNLISVLSPISAKANGSISLTARNIEVTGNLTGSANLATATPITTESGNITLIGNSSALLTGGYVGVNLRNANLTSASGNIVVDGKTSSDGIYGVYMSGEVLDGSGDPIPGCRTTILKTGGEGNISVTGLIENTTTTGSSGASLSAIIVQTNNGSFTINGTLNGSAFITEGLFAARFSGSNFTSSGSGNFNLSANATATGDIIRSAVVDSSTITVSTGSINIAGENYAIGNQPQAAYFTGSTIRSNGSGNITVTGTNYNNSTDASAAVYCDSSVFENSNGTIAITGISFDQNTTLTPCGVLLTSSALISVVRSGNVVISGSTPVNANGVGIKSESGSSVKANGGLITLNANAMNLLGNVNATTAGNVLIQAMGLGVNLGGADDSANLGLTSAEIANITANLLTIGNSTTGKIVVTAAMSRTGNLTLISGNAITQTDPGNLTISGTANFVSTGTGTAGNITLNNATNNFGTVTACGTNITVYHLNNITIGAITASGDFTVQGVNSTSCISVTGPINATGGSGNVALTGRNIVVTGNITTAAGDITLSGNGGGSYQSGTFDGVCISGSSVNVNTTSGNILIDGRGSSASNNYGVQVNQSRVQAGSAGNLTINGISGNGTGTIYGVYLYNGTVSTVDGLTNITGTSNGLGSDCFGVTLEGSSANATVTASGNGGIQMTGISGTGNVREYGIHLKTRAAVTTNNGPITVLGRSRSTSSRGSLIDSYGIYYVDSNIFGFMASGSQGCISLTGETANASGVGLYLGRGKVATSGGPITLNANSVSMGSTASVNATTAGEVVFQHSGNGSFTLNNITANSLTLTSVNGTISACGISTIANNVNLAATGNIAIATISSSGGNILAATDQANSCISITGNMTTTGSGTISLTGRNIVVTSGIRTTSGEITLNADNGVQQSGDFKGIYLNGASANIASTSGNIILSGRAGNADTVNQIGIYLYNGAKVSTGGNGSVSFTGYSGNGPGAYAMGVRVQNSTVTTNNGSFIFNGTSYGTGSFCWGSYIDSSSNITIGGSGSFIDTGVGANSSENGLYGARIQSSNVTVANGNIIITGTALGTGSSENGFQFDSGNITATGTGGVYITGYTTSNSSSYAVNSAGKITANTGLVQINANSINLSGTVTANTGGVSIQTTGLGIALGSADDSSNLGLTQSEINKITTNLLTIGNTTTGNISITSAVSFTSGNISLITGGSIIETGAGCISASYLSNFSAVGDVLLNNVTNVFTGNVSATGVNITIWDIPPNKSSIKLGNINATGNLDVYNPCGTIVQNTGSIFVGGSSNFRASGNITLGNSYNTFSGSIDACGTNITIAANNNIALGNITGSGNVSVSGSTSASCISVTGPIDASSGVGNITLSGRNIIVSGNISTSSGDISLFGNGGGSYQAGAFDGVCISGSGVNVNSTSGNLWMDGRAAGNSNLSGVNITSALITTGLAGNINITGISGNLASGTYSTFGVYLSGASLSTANGDIHATGYSNGTTNGTFGLYGTYGSNLQATGTGGIYLAGTATSGNGTNFGLLLSRSASVTTNNGPIELSGTSYGTGDDSVGVYLNTGANLVAGGSGSVNITGNAASGADDAQGIHTYAAYISSNNGNIVINGTSSGTGVTPVGIFFVNSTISSIGAGGLNVSGIALNNQDFATGIFTTRSNFATTSGPINVNGSTNSTGLLVYGLYLENGTTFNASGAGNETITGTTNGHGTGIYQDSGVQFLSNGSQISLIAESMELLGSINVSSSGNVLIDTSSGNSSSSNLRLPTITTGNLVINANSVMTTQSPNSNLTVFNSTNLTSSGSVTLSNATNSLGNLNVSTVSTTLSGSSANQLTLTSGNLVSSANLGSLVVNVPNMNFSANITGGTIAGAIDVTGGYVTLGGVQQGNLTVNSVNSAVVINTPIGGLTTVTNSCQTIVNANLAGGLLINSTTGGVYFNPDAIINVDATTITGNVPLQIIPANTTLASLQQASGSVSLTGTITGVANISGGSFSSNGVMTNLNVNGGAANLTGGLAVEATVNSGTIESSGSITALYVEGGRANVTGGFVCATYSNATLYVVDSGYINLLFIYNGITTDLGCNTRLSSVNVLGGVANLGGNQTGSVWVNGPTADVSITRPANSVNILQSNSTLINANILNSLNIQSANANASFGSGLISLAETNISANAIIAFPANITISNLTAADSSVSLYGSVTGLANLTSGLLISNGTIGLLVINATGTANISGGTIGATTTAGTLNSSGGLFSSLESSGTTVLTGGSVSGTTNITGGNFNTATAFATLSGTINVSGGLVELGGTQAGSLNVSGGLANLTSSIGSELNVSGTGSAIITTGATVTGLTTVLAGNLTTNGTLSGGLVATGGSVNTYNTGTTAGSNLTLFTGSALNTSGSSIASYGRIAASNVTISNATLALSPSFTMANESAFTIIDNTGTSVVNGIFNGLPEGSMISAGGNNLTISYVGGPGHNNVVLYRTGGLLTAVNTDSDVTDPNDGLITLREAVDYARLNAATTGANQTVSFNLIYPAVITLQAGADYGVINVNQNSSLSITGPLVASGHMLTVSGGGVTGIFNLTSPTNISNMTLTQGNNTWGGAIDNNTTTTIMGLTIQDSLAFGGGAICNRVGGNLTVINSTIVNNHALIAGGGIMNDGNVAMSFSTVALNQADVHGGGLDGYRFDLLNTIVANNTCSMLPDINGHISANYCLIGNPSGSVISSSNNQLNVNPLLGSLDYYGGNTKVLPLLPGSPAINSGFGSNATDQRGITGVGTNDIGAFQSRGFNITRLTGNNQTAMIGDTFSANLSLSIASAYSEPVDGGVITFTAPVAANTPSASLAGSTTISGGNVSLQATANAYYGTAANQTYTVAANATGVAAGTCYRLLNVGTPYTMSITSGNGQSGNITGNLGQTLGVNVKDNVGNNIPQLSITFTPTTLTNTNNGTFGALGNIAGAGAGSVYTGLTDANGNLTGLTFAGNGIGGLFQVQANATVSAIGGVRAATTRLANFTEGTIGLNVQNGTAGRSFVNAVSGVFGSSGLAANLSASQLKIQFLGYDGTSNATNVTLANGTAASGNINWNYGANGITGDPNSQNGDGVYQLAVDYNNDGVFETTVKFYRLFGDVNGDRVVDTTDYNVVINPAVYGKLNITSGANTNGVGQVYTKDVTTVLRQRGRRVGYNIY